TAPLTCNSETILFTRILVFNLSLQPYATSPSHLRSNSPKHLLFPRMVSKVLLTATVALLAFGIHIYLPAIRSQFLLPNSKPHPNVATVTSLKSNTPLERLLEFVGPVLKSIAKFFSNAAPLEGERSLLGLKGKVEVSFDKWGGTSWPEPFLLLSSL